MSWIPMLKVLGVLILALVFCLTEPAWRPWALAGLVLITLALVHFFLDRRRPWAVKATRATAPRPAGPTPAAAPLAAD